MEMLKSIQSYINSKDVSIDCCSKHCKNTGWLSMQTFSRRMSRMVGYS